MYSRLIVAVLFTIIGHHVGSTQMLYGCAIGGTSQLCQPDESCIDDALELELLRVELTRLYALGFDWTASRTQCVIAYFKLSIAYQLEYDADFCSVQSPENVWALLQLVEQRLADTSADDEEVVVVPISERDDDDDAINAIIRQLKSPENDDSDQSSSDSRDNIILVDKRPENYQLTADDESRLVPIVDAMLNGEDPDMSTLSDEQLERLIGYIKMLQKILENRIGYTVGELEEVIPLDMDSGTDEQQLLLKKDIEELGDINQGLAHIEHKIVKGVPAAVSWPADALPPQIDKVVGNRVYIRLERPLDQAQLLQLMAYLEEVIGRPKNLTFDQFDVSADQVSFRVSRIMFTSTDPFDVLRELLLTSSSSADNDSHDAMVPASSVAEAVYKRRKDIQTISGASIDETGIGSGEEKVPVESRERDWILVPTLVVCSFVVFVLVALLAVYAIRHQQRRRRQVDDFEARPSRAYQELCRQRMGAKTTDGGIGRFVSSSSAYGDQQQPTSKTSSTSSWCEEPVQQSNMDITTGHIILSYLEEYLKSQQTLDAEWSALELYRNLNATTDIAKLSENQDKNRFQDVLPYDHTLIRLQYGADADIAQCGEYINASMLYDSDPRTAVYIATQAPMLTTAAEFWQMVWEQGAVVIVNLTKLSEKCHRYWPDNGSEVLGVFEVHLVSEHIWSEDYLVRSFYLKNLRTNETRTVTQFHFVSWPDTNIPNAKALLEFRRKVNKSYRGRLSPIIVHCSDGAGRTGTYCLLDMVLNRINKGVKELDIAASLEHLRDQRPNMVQTKEQYKFVVCCVAEEVNAMLKALPQ